ncbi:hypothetical protein IHE45_18G066800 [Dioscorea alata]|uniref:Uncharacterized protein n=1 Tax=Dioscorea alata TaxID=55571 RepID=A0ACB7U7Q6_DIOAL|nr:hypothetical protein IHE45_18G066800 [Dioscorea alata]
MVTGVPNLPTTNLSQRSRWENICQAINFKEKRFSFKCVCFFLISITRHDVLVGRDIKTLNITETTPSWSLPMMGSMELPQVEGNDGSAALACNVPDLTVNGRDPRAGSSGRLGAGQWPCC